VKTAGPAVVGSFFASISIFTWGLGHLVVLTLRQHVYGRRLQVLSLLFLSRRLLGRGDRLTFCS
jgi:hypothetical protein